MKKKLHKVFVYGTLRDGAEATHSLQPNVLLQLVEGKNFNFPMLQPVDFDLPFRVIGNVLEVTFTRLKELDRYESTASGLYQRVKLPVNQIGSDTAEDMWVYIAGPELSRPIISSGDWLQR